MEILFEKTTIAVLLELSLVACSPSIFSNFPAGEYRMYFKTMFVCFPQKDNKISMNLYVHHKSNNSSEIKGNITSKIPIDDTIDMDINIATGNFSKGWKDNQFVHKVHNGCSSFKLLMGKAYTAFAKNMGFPNFNCPVPQGVYVSSGFDTSNFRDSNFPKTMIYGTYRVQYSYTRKNEILGCTVIILDVKRS